MQSGEAKEAEGSLLKITRVCRFLNIAMKILFVVFCVGWLLVAGLMVSAFFDSGISQIIGKVSILNLVLCLVYGVIMATMLIAFIGMFADVSKGESPFTMIQVKRLRTIAGMLVLYAFIDSAIAYNSVMLKFNGLSSGYMSTNEGAVIPINFAPLIAAAVVFAFSFVFKYGVLLQELSDDTL